MEKDPIARGASCLKVAIWIALVLLVLVFVTFFVASALGNLGVWEEFWELIEQKTGFHR